MATDGDMLARMGADADAWARELILIAKPVLTGYESDLTEEDVHDTLRGWFANAIEVGRTEGEKGIRESLMLPNGNIEPIPTLVQEIAVMALGRISVSMFHRARSVREADYLTMRDGRRIGYGELAIMMAEAVKQELEDRRG